MTQNQTSAATSTITITGTVQGVGFRPYVWRIAVEMGLCGEVWNSAAGVEIILHHADPSEADVSKTFIERLKAECPPLAVIEAITIEHAEESRDLAKNAERLSKGFSIKHSQSGEMKTRITPDAATCKDCVEEITNPTERRYKYPFTNCTHCGPRLTIIHEAPYDRANTSMSPFTLCPACRKDYENPADRRFHAQPIACPACGPVLSLVALNGAAGNEGAILEQGEEALERCINLLKADNIIAIKGLGGFHLACRAVSEDLVKELRRLKQRSNKAFALMYRDCETAKKHLPLTTEQQALLQSPAAPIVLVPQSASNLPASIAPGLAEIGIMLPSTPLHHLIMAEFDEPLIMTSGNLSDHPQFIENEMAIEGLSGIADYALLHNRAITSRVDDSVARQDGAVTTLLRRARGYAPAPIKLPIGFENAPDLIAYGSELKSTFTLLKDGAAITSQHLGDLENVPSFDAYQHAIALYTDLFNHRPTARIVDMHPDYLSAKYGRALSAEDHLPLIEVQHHHAHMAAALGENGTANDDNKHLGLILDGVGYGLDGTIWGGELFYGNYKYIERLGAFPAIPLPGAVAAIGEPWRNLVAHIETALGWPQFIEQSEGLSLLSYLKCKPTETLRAMMAKGLNSPKASSCGRLFDAVAAALQLSADKVTYEGEAAMQLEALIDQRARDKALTAAVYPLHFTQFDNRLDLNFAPLWQALLSDLKKGEAASFISACFHHSLATGLAEWVRRAANTLPEAPTTIALSGGCLQNRTLRAELTELLNQQGLQVHNNNKLPANDGGISYGQALIAAAQILDNSK
ncbi:MAG: carbamoyltransferase HypF [Rhodomicrobium sp.]|nr:MAG: carbamoyltransferase HypF [Rhodomicrobium sp.]